MRRLPHRRPAQGRVRGVVHSRGVQTQRPYPLYALSGIDREANGAIQILVENRYFKGSLAIAQAISG
jgi:hypothetical protein